MYRYTPINKFRLTQRGREIIRDVDKWITRTTIKKITVSAKDYELLLNSISPSTRADYLDEIPYDGHKIVRGK